jgi:hypothetical protein
VSHRLTVAGVLCRDVAHVGWLADRWYLCIPVQGHGLLAGGGEKVRSVSWRDARWLEGDRAEEAQQKHCNNRNSEASEVEDATQIAQEVVPACSLQQVSNTSDPARDPELSLGSVVSSPRTTRAPPCTRDAGYIFFAEAEEGSLQDLCSSANAAAVQQLHRSCHSTLRCRSSTSV